MVQRADLDKTGLASEVYDRLATALMSGALAPGTRLKIRDLAEEMQLSVTPVRDAVLRLVNNGGLSFRSPRDIRVPVLERAQYLEIRAIRLELEGLAAYRAAQFATSADIQLLEQNIDENEEALRNGDMKSGLKLNQRFHLLLPTVGRYETLAGILGNLWLRMGPLIASGYLEGGRVMIDNHYPVLAAIKDANADAARDAIRTDILSGGDVLLRKGALA